MRIQPILPLLHAMEERAGERRRHFCLFGLGLPLSSILSPLLRRGERKKKTHVWKFARLARIWTDAYRFRICATLKTTLARRHTAGFTMVEIALCLAIIGFALVAIIGILPSGMNVQKDNREETIIRQDAMYLMEAIRSGSRVMYDL